MSLGSMFGKSSLSIAFIKPSTAFAGEVPQLAKLDGLVWIFQGQATQ